MSLLCTCAFQDLSKDLKGVQFGQFFIALNLVSNVLNMARLFIFKINIQFRNHKNVSFNSYTFWIHVRMCSHSLHSFEFQRLVWFDSNFKTLNLFSLQGHFSIIPKVNYVPKLKFQQCVSPRKAFLQNLFKLCCF